MRDEERRHEEIDVTAAAADAAFETHARARYHEDEDVDQENVEHILLEEYPHPDQPTLLQRHV
jgi:hypothetical protein